MWTPLRRRPFGRRKNDVTLIFWRCGSDFNGGTILFLGLDANNDLPIVANGKKQTQLDRFPMWTVRSAPGSALSVWNLRATCGVKNVLFLFFRFLSSPYFSLLCVCGNDTIASLECISLTKKKNVLKIFLTFEIKKTNKNKHKIHDNKHIRFLFHFGILMMDCIDFSLHTFRIGKCSCPRQSPDQINRSFLSESVIFWPLFSIVSSWNMSWLFPL